MTTTPSQPRTPTEPRTSGAPRSTRTKTAAITALLMIVAFLAGYVPKHLEARRASEALAASNRELRLATLQRQLGLASHEAMRNQYPAAAEAAHAFFDGCRAAVNELDLDDRPRTRLALDAYASSAPEILTQLNLGNPAMKEQLASLYITMHGLLERKQ